MLLRSGISLLSLWMFLPSSPRILAIDVPKPAALYPLNAVHNTSDISGNDLPEGLKSNVELVTEQSNGGPIGGSYFFAGGSSSYIEIPAHDKLDTKNSFTLLVWIKPSKSGPVIHYHARDYWGVHFWITSSSATTLFGRPSLRTSRESLPGVQYHLPKAFTWYYVGFTYDFQSGAQKLFVDGKQVYETNIAGAGHDLATNLPIRMGATVVDGRYYKGYITCFQLYNVSLTEKQVQHVRDRCTSPHEHAGPDVLFAENRRQFLSGHVIRTLTGVRSLEACLKLCRMFGNLCKSFSYCTAQGGGNICQINDATASEYSDHMVTSSNWVHYEPALMEIMPYP